MTNADRIRNMSDEELAEWLTNMCDIERHEEPYKSIYNLDTEKEEEIHDSYGDLLKWLQSEEEQEEKDMYCNGTCKYLNERKHKCELTGEKLSYMKQTGSLSFTVHEHRGICKGDRKNGRQIFI